MASGENKNYRNLAIGGLFILAYHFLMVGIYNFSDLSEDNSIIKRAAFRYVHPFFFQNFKLFAPDPPKSHREIYFRIEDSFGNKSNWINPGKEDLDIHSKFRFTHHAKLRAGYDYISRNMEYLHEQKLKGQYEILEKTIDRYFLLQARKHYPHTSFQAIETAYIIYTPVIKNGKIEIEKKAALFSKKQLH
ncbi:MAG: DUF5819 family protein [Bacteroidia bacterium]